MLAVLLSTLVLAAASEPSPASPGASAAAPEQPAKPPAGKDGKDAKAPELVCHNEKPTGSHMIERVCFTRQESDQAEQAAQGAMNSINRRAKAAANPPK